MNPVEAAEGRGAEGQASGSGEGPPAAPGTNPARGESPPEGNRPTVPVVRVALRPDQTARIAAATGVTLTVLEIEDPIGLLAATMHSMTPPDIERLAMVKARGEQEAATARREALEDLARQQDREREAQKAIEAEVRHQEEWAEAQRAALAEAAARGAVIEAPSPSDGGAPGGGVGTAAGLTAEEKE